MINLATVRWAESIMRRATLPIVGVGFTVGGAVRCWRHVLI